MESQAAALRVINRVCQQMVNVDQWGPTAEEREGGRPATMAESHIGELVNHMCPLCAWPQALLYPDHGGLLVCENCQKTYDPEVE